MIQCDPVRQGRRSQQSDRDQHISSCLEAGDAGGTDLCLVRVSLLGSSSQLVYRSRARIGRFLHFHRNRASGVVEWDWESMPIDWRTGWLSVDGTRARDVRVLLSRKSEWQTSMCDVSSARTPQPRRALDSPWNGASLILLSRSVMLYFTCCRARCAALVQPRCSTTRPALCLWSVCMLRAATCAVDWHGNGDQFARRHSSDGAEPT